MVSQVIYTIKQSSLQKNMIKLIMHQYYAISVLIHLYVGLHIVMYLKLKETKYEIKKMQLLNVPSSVFNAALSTRRSQRTWWTKSHPSWVNINILSEKSSQPMSLRSTKQKNPVWKNRIAKYNHLLEMHSKQYRI